MPSEDHKIRDSLNHGYNENGIKFLLAITQYRTHGLWFVVGAK